MISAVSLRHLAVLGLGLFAFLTMPLASSAEEWERVVDAARAAQDKEFAQTRGNEQQLLQIAARYGAAARAQGTASAHYLYGRALFVARKMPEAQRALEQALRVDARFWFADRTLAQVALARENLDLAEHYTRKLIARRANDAEGRRLLALVAMGREQWAQAASLLEALQKQEPQSAELMTLLLTVYMRQEAYGKATKLVEDRLKVTPANVALRDQYARLLAMNGEFRKAANQFERVLRDVEDPAAILAMLEICYARVEDWKKVEQTLVRLRAVTKDPQELKRIDFLIAELKKGPPKPGEGGEGARPADPLVKLHAECLDPDPAVRRASLEKWLDADIRLVPSTFLERLHDPSVETDVPCRIRIVRILGSLAIEDSAHSPMPNLGLVVHQDPDLRVRRVAIDELGRSTTDASLVYLLPAFMDYEVTRVPAQGPALESHVAEYNALRRAVRARASFRDLPPLSDDFVKAENLAANRAKWETYLASGEGQQVMREAIRAFAAVPEPQPENYLRAFLFGPNMEVTVVREAFRVLLAHARQAAATGEPFMRQRYADFPQIDPDSITDATVRKMRTDLRDWWVRASRR